jgi:two-component system, OmpR family, response regulator
MKGADRRLVVVADDDDSMRLLCRVNLEFEGYRVAEAESAEELERALESEDVAVVLLDIRLGEDDGIEVARGLRERYPDLPIAFLSGSVSLGELATIADASIAKPFTLEELIETVHRLARR